MKRLGLITIITKYEMSSKRIIFVIGFFALTACNHNQTVECREGKSDDSLQTQTFFNKNEKVFVVQKIGADTIDPNGNKCNLVEMKNAEGEIFENFFHKGDPVSIGDSVWIGNDASGKSYIVSKNKTIN